MSPPPSSAIATPIAPAINPGATCSRGTLIVRLRNWVGDVTLGLPMLQRLADAGYSLQLLGKGWAHDLLAGQGWPVQTLAGDTRGRIAQLRALRRATQARDAGFGRGIGALCLPYSFSSALEFRLAGLRALGHAYEGRSLLLGRAVPRRQGVHELQVYWQLADALLGETAPLPHRIGLKTTTAQQQQAASLLQRQGIAPGERFVVVCPFAGGTWSGQDKTWPGFPTFVADVLLAAGHRVLVLPGPGEDVLARERFGAATVLPGVSLGVYAAVLQRAALMVSNDTGPGHIAAAVGTPLVSVLGPSDPELWRPWGEDVQLLQSRVGKPDWPVLTAVAEAAFAVLARGDSTLGKLVTRAVTPGSAAESATSSADAVPPPPAGQAAT
jgi:heptosyltransferase-2